MLHNIRIIISIFITVPFFPFGVRTADCHHLRLVLRATPPSFSQWKVTSPLLNEWVVFCRYATYFTHRYRHPRQFTRLFASLPTSHLLNGNHTSKQPRFCLSWHSLTALSVPHSCVHEPFGITSLMRYYHLCSSEIGKYFSHFITLQSMPLPTSFGIVILCEVSCSLSHHSGATRPLVYHRLSPVVSSPPLYGFGSGIHATMSTLIPSSTVQNVGLRYPQFVRYTCLMFP